MNAHNPTAGLNSIKINYLLTKNRIYIRRDYMPGLRGSLREEDVISLRTAGDISLPKEASCFHPSLTCPGLQTEVKRPHDRRTMRPPSSVPYNQPLYDNIKLPMPLSPGNQPHLVQPYDRYVSPVRFNQVHMRESGDYASDVHSVTSRLSSVSVETNRSDPTDLRFSTYLVSKLIWAFFISNSST